MTQTMAVLTEGATDVIKAKTAVALLRYRADDVACLIDSDIAGQTCGAILGDAAGANSQNTPIVADLTSAIGVEASLKTLVIGIATAGGVLPPAMRSAVLSAAERGWTVISGLHQFLIDDPEIRQAAEASGGQLVDLRRNTSRHVATGSGFNERCYRLHTVGNDCSVGKMVVSVEMARGLTEAGFRTAFLGTGQTGMLIGEDGVPIDAVVADFINGAAEALVQRRDSEADIVVIEGQGSLAHPSYSSVTLGLLHGSRPDGLIMCYEAQRPHMHGRPHLAVPDFMSTMRLYESMANTLHPCAVVGVAMNSRRLDDSAAVEAERQRMVDLTGLPVVDVWREGTGELVEAVSKHRTLIGKASDANS